MTRNGHVNRRTVLRAVAGIAGAAATTATTPWPGASVMAQADPGQDADALFRAGEFEQAGLAYEEILEQDPENVHAARQRGYVALLSNNFPDAERYLAMAIELAPEDTDANRLLADCYTRQDKFSLAAPRWRAAGEDAYGAVFEAIGDEPYQVEGDIGRAPWLQMDPSPLVEVSLNGGPTRNFAFYTNVASVGMSAAVAREAGLNAVAEVTLDYLDPPRTMYFGVLDSFRLGGIEVRNIPVGWSDDDDEPSLTGGAGMIGTWLFYHFLTTIDYAGRSLILRRRTPEMVTRVRAGAERAGAEPLPLWLAREHIPFSLGSINDSGPRVMGLNIGGIGEMMAGMTEDTARRLGVRTDYDRPLETTAALQPIVTYPCYPEEIRLGDAVATDAYCLARVAGERAAAPHGFEVLGHFSHSFYKPYHVTLDFTDMQLYIAHGKAD